MGEKQTKEQRFKSYLRGGEQVRWHGTTKPFSLLERDAPEGKTIIADMPLNYR